MQVVTIIDRFRVGCWAHVLRKFKEAYKVQAKLKLKKTPLTLQAIKQIRALYKIEDEADESGFSPQQRQVLRQARSKPLLKTLRKWLTIIGECCVLLNLTRECSSILD